MSIKIDSLATLNVTVATDSTKLPLTGGTMSGNIENIESDSVVTLNNDLIVGGTLTANGGINGSFTSDVYLNGNTLRLGDEPFSAAFLTPSQLLVNGGDINGPLTNYVEINGDGWIYTSRSQGEGSSGELDSSILTLSTLNGFVRLSPEEGLRFADGTIQTTAANGEGGGGSDPTKLPLTGGIMSGNIRFDEVGIQSIGKGTFDAGRGAYNGISIICANDVELNWQAGYLKAIYNGSVVPINFEDSNLILTKTFSADEDYPLYTSNITVEVPRIGSGGTEAGGIYGTYTIPDAGTSGFSLNADSVSGTSLSNGSNWSLGSGGMQWSYNQSDIYINGGISGHDTDNFPFGLGSNGTNGTFDNISWGIGTSGVILTKNIDGVEGEISPYTKTTTISVDGEISYNGSNEINDHGFILNQGGVYGSSGSDEHWGLTMNGVGTSGNGNYSNWSLNSIHVIGLPNLGNDSWELNKSSVGGANENGSTFGLNTFGVGGNNDDPNGSWGFDCNGLGGYNGDGNPSDTSFSLNASKVSGHIDTYVNPYTEETVPAKDWEFGVDGLKFTNGTVIDAPTVGNSGLSQSGNIAHTDYPKEIQIVIGGVTYAIPARIIT